MTVCYSSITGSGGDDSNDYYLATCTSEPYSTPSIVCQTRPGLTNVISNTCSIFFSHPQSPASSDINQPNFDLVWEDLQVLETEVHLEGESLVTAPPPTIYHLPYTCVHVQVGSNL